MAASSDEGRFFAGYFLKKQIGQGGMASVYLAERIGPDGARKRFALKRILKQHTESEAFVERFKAEMGVAASLEHRNILDVVDFGVQDGTYFLVLEFVRGMNLRELAQRLKVRAEEQGPEYLYQEHGVLPAPVVALIGMRVAEGLAYAHLEQRTGRRGVVHRDLSRDNVMVDIDAQVLIVDWGIAKSVRLGKLELTATETFAGKMLYAPPEQIKGSELDGRADLFALGVTLFRLLAPHYPYDDLRYPKEDVMARAYRATKDQRDPIAKMLPHAPPVLQELIERMLRADRNERIGSAEEVARVLRPLARQPLAHGRYPEEELGHLVRLVYTEDDAPPTRPETQSMADPNSWPEGSPERQGGGVLARTHDVDEAPDTVVLEPDTQGPPVRAHTAAPSTPEKPSEPHISAYRTAAPSPVSTRSLYVALAVVCVLVVGLLAGIAGFALSGGSEPASEAQAAVEPPDEPPPAAADPTPADPASATPEPPPVPSVPTTAAPEATDAGAALVSEPAPDNRQLPGRVRVVVIPMGTVFIDGRARGAAPVTASLSPGAHTVVARHPDGRMSPPRRVRVRSGRTTQLQMRFR